MPPRKSKKKSQKKSTCKKSSCKKSSSKKTAKKSQKKFTFPKVTPLKIAWFAFLAIAITVSTGASILIAKSDPGALATNLRQFSWSQKYGEETITMLFTGDIMLGRYIATLRERNAENAPDFPFTYMPEVTKTVAESLGITADELDLVVGNLEGPITDSNYVNPGTAMIFNFQPEVTDLLAKSGFTTLSMANNHQHDQGVQGIDQTYNYLQAAGLTGFGHPDTPDGPYSVATYEFNTATIGFLGLSDVDYSLDEEAALAKIRELDAATDFLIIGIHWGVEYETTARQSITDLAHQFVDAGADMIWGHHPHVIQNWEVYKDAPIYYSLGNFVFDQYWSSATQEGLVVGLRLDTSPDGHKITTTQTYVDLVDQGAPKPREI